MRAKLRWIVSLLAFVGVFSLGFVPFSIFLVKLLVEKGYSNWYAGFSLSMLFGAGVIGGFLGGILSDRYRRRIILPLAVLGGISLLYLYLWFEDRSYVAIPVLFVADVLARIVHEGLKSGKPPRVWSRCLDPTNP